MSKSKFKGLELEDMLAEFLRSKGYIVFVRLLAGKCDLCFLRSRILYVLECKNYVVPGYLMRRVVRRLNRIAKVVAEKIRNRGLKFDKVVSVLVARGFEKTSGRCLCFTVEDFLRFF
ncbi:MAG: hypothetical protein ACTSYM_05810 [Candidatus Baldrarchaeia archaeon]